jgi:hypothetical protein
MRDKLMAGNKLPPNIPPPWIIEKINEAERRKEKPRQQPSIKVPGSPQTEKPGQEKRDEDDGTVDYTI